MRRLFTGMGVFAAVAAVFFVLGCLAVLLEVQSPSFVMWNGIKVTGYTQNGLAYYQYHGQQYAIDNVHASASDSRKRPTTVWLPRSDPTDDTHAYVENPYTRWSDFTFVTGWFVVALALLAAGFLRRLFRRRRRVETMGQFGGGISDHVVRELIAKRRTVRRVEFSDDE